MHRACVELLPKLIAPYLPELKLRPYPLRWLPTGGPDPDVITCLWYFGRCRELRSQENAAQHVGDLLLEFEDKYPIEWECSGWKNEFVAEMVLGDVQRGEFSERRDYAMDWFSRRWKHEERIERQLTRELLPQNVASADAAFELDMIDFTARATIASVALRGGDSAGWDTAFVKSVDYPHIQFIRWLNESWVKLKRSSEATQELEFRAPVPKELPPNWILETAVKAFRKKHPNCNLENHDLVDIFAAFREAERRNALPIPPSIVLLKFVASRHGISDAKLRHYLAKSGKELQRPRRPRGKSARASDKS
jgi:hypothetical protein